MNGPRTVEDTNTKYLNFDRSRPPSGPRAHPTNPQSEQGWPWTRYLDEPGSGGSVTDSWEGGEARGWGVVGGFEAFEWQTVDRGTENQGNLYAGSNEFSCMLCANKCFSDCIGCNTYPTPAPPTPWAPELTCARNSVLAHA